MKNNLDKYLKIANEAKKENSINDEFIALIPMLKVVNGKLYVAVTFVKSNDNIWDKEEGIVPEYWCLIDINNDQLVEFNKTTDKSFNDDAIITNNSDDSFNKEISKYVVKTKMKYKELIKNDITNVEELSFQNKVEKLIKNIKVDDEFVSFNDYFYSNYENDLNEQIDKLVDLIAATKYNSLTTYYEILFNNIVDEYSKNKIVNVDKIKLAFDMMNSYYQGVNGLENLFFN